MRLGMPARSCRKQDMTQAGFPSISPSGDGAVIVLLIVGAIAYTRFRSRISGSRSADRCGHHAISGCFRADRVRHCRSPSSRNQRRRGHAVSLQPTTPNGQLTITVTFK